MLLHPLQSLWHDLLVAAGATYPSPSPFKPATILTVRSPTVLHTSGRAKLELLLAARPAPSRPPNDAAVDIPADGQSFSLRLAGPPCALPRRRSGARASHEPCCWRAAGALLVAALGVRSCPRLSLFVSVPPPRGRLRSQLACPLRALRGTVHGAHSLPLGPERRLRAALSSLPEVGSVVLARPCSSRLTDVSAQTVMRYHFARRMVRARRGTFGANLN